MTNAIKSVNPVQLRGDRWVTDRGQGLWDVRVRYTDGTERLLVGRPAYTLAQAQAAAARARRDGI